MPISSIRRFARMRIGPPRAVAVSKPSPEAAAAGIHCLQIQSAVASPKGSGTSEEETSFVTMRPRYTPSVAALRAALLRSEKSSSTPPTVVPGGAVLVP
jgi:hypothetical protein